LKKVKELSMAEKQMVEIAKAISLDVEVLIMDEPTSVLTDKEINALFGLIRELKGKGITIFYISHKLNEVKQVCDRVTVLRDGKLVETKNIDEVSVHDLANLMVGREIENYYPEKGTPGEKTVFAVQGLSVPGLLEDISFNLREGEILGFFGLVGAGRTELAEAIMGIRPRMKGKIFLNQSEISLKSPEEAIRANLAYLSEDRQGRALVTSLKVNHNTTLISLKQYCHPFITAAEENQATNGYVDKLNIKVNTVEDTVKNLSGGNQQKVAFAKWFETDPRILILDEPTRGIDVNAKREIYGIIKAQAATGRSCIIISSELPELLGTCHRILVMRNGRISGEIQGDEATEEKIMYLATGIGIEKGTG
jgi:ribose transport system ATP-binding protein